ncbi:MAG: hypothetical protein LUC23_03310 [Prevotellaceae bacterium]|nr:hypothetical protein [Prevotellaceae bacterium]
MSAFGTGNVCAGSWEVRSAITRGAAIVGARLLEPIEEMEKEPVPSSSQK